MPSTCSLRRLLGDEVVASPAMDEAAAVARRAARAAQVRAGRWLRLTPRWPAWPDEPHLALWHALTVLREHRGDGHVAALVLAGIGPCEALLLHGAGPQRFRARAPAGASRDWPDDEWEAHREGPGRRGLAPRQ